MKKTKKKITKSEGNFELRNEWISTFEDLDRELEKICEKMDIPSNK